MQFSYVAYTLEQGLVRGKLDAENELEASQQIASRGFKPLEIKQSRSLPALEEIFPSVFAVKTGQLVRFSRQLAPMVRGGSSLQRALEMLQAESSNRVLKRVLANGGRSVDQGNSLSAALSLYPSIFNTRYVSVVQVGEQTGGLASSLEQLADALEREHETIQRFKRTMMMPLFTMTASMGMLILMMTVMLPPLLEAFESRGAGVPLITQIAIVIVNAIQGNMLTIGGVLLTLGIVYNVLRRVQTAHVWLHGIQVKVPIFGSLIIAKELAQFSRTNSMLLESGCLWPKRSPWALRAAKT